MKLFGGPLPFIGWRMLNKREVQALGCIDLFPHSPVGEWEVFQIEWLWIGVILHVRAYSD